MKRTLATLVVLGLIAGISNAQILTGSFPEGGGNISITASGGNLALSGVDLQSASGGLIVAGDAAPFQFLLSDTANQITYGNLGTVVDLADGASLELTAGAAAGTADIVAAWGDGANPVAFEVTEDITVVEGPSVTWSSAIVTGTTIANLITGDAPIQFTPAEYPGSTSGTGGFFTGDGGDTGNAGLNEVLDSHGWNGDGATVLIEGLTTGNDYQIQLLMGDTRACCLDRTQTASDGINTSEAFSRNGGSVVGSFTSTGESLALTIAGEADPGLSGYVLWNSTTGSLAQAINFTSDGASPSVPEPAALPMCLAAAIGILGLRRRRN